MKAKQYIIGGIAGLGIASIIYFTMSPEGVQENAEDVADTHEEHHHGSVGKTVELNKAQYTNAGIELGWFQKKNISDVIHANGYTKLPPQNQAEVSVFTTGLVKSIKVIEGEQVKKGQVLASVESPEFARIQQDYLIAKSNLEYLRLEYDRQLKLSEADVNAKKVLEKTKSDLDIEQAKYNALKKQLDLLKMNGEGSPVASIPILAPISGHITDVYINIGSAVEMGKPLFSIVDNSEMHVDLMVYEKDLFKVDKGQTVRFVLTNQSNKEYTGTIFNIGKSFHSETKTVAVHAHIVDKEKELIPGMYVNALIDAGLNEVKTLPEEAVVEAEGRNFIFVQQDSHDNHSVFRRIEVKTGPSQLGSIQVTPVKKIRKGEKIVVNGAYYLQSHLQKSEGGGGHSH